MNTKRQVLTGIASIAAIGIAISLCVHNKGKGAADKEAAGEYIRQAIPLASFGKFDEVGEHYKQVADIIPSYRNSLTALLPKPVR